MARQGKDSDTPKGGRRKSFVAANPADNDFVPTLPAVGSAPIPAARDINLFPPVQTGKPQLAQPSAPARLVVPTRQSLTSDEVAMLFAGNAEMSSAEQIALLDAQMTLRDADLAAVREFVTLLRRANPDEAVPLLADVKSRFHDLDDEVALLSLTSIPDGTPEPVVTPEPEPPLVVSAPVVETVAPVSPVSPPAVDTPTVDAVFGSMTIPAETPVPIVPGSMPKVPVPSYTAGRHRGWSVVIGFATLLATFVPLTFAVFTGFGSPQATLAGDLQGIPGVVVIILVTIVSIPLTALARTTSVRHALTWRAALERVTGKAGGILLGIFVAISMVAVLVSTLLSISSAVVTQVTEIPLVTPLFASLAPNAHLSALLAGSSLLVGFVIAALPRGLYRAKILTLTGFMLAGPAVVIITSLAVIAMSGTGSLSSSTIVFTAAVIPIVLGLMAATESGSTTITRRDGEGASGAWLFVGLGLGIAFSAWSLVSSLGGGLSATSVGGNPALHLTGGSDLVTTIFGAVVIVVPTVLIAALVGRGVLAVFVSDDRGVAPGWVRVVLALSPLVLIGADVVGLVSDPVTALPGTIFLAVPILVVTGMMAGASVAARKGIRGGARVANFIVGVVLVLVGFALTAWAATPLQNVYHAIVAPVVSRVGLGESGALVVPALLVAFSFVASLIVSSAGLARTDEND